MHFLRPRGVCAEKGVVPFVQGMWSCHLERGGGGHSYEKAPTGLLFWSVLELAAQQVDSGAEGKTVVRIVALSRLASSYGWSGTPRTPCGGHNEKSYGVSDRVVFPYRASCNFASALPFVGRAPGRGDGAVGMDPIASSVSHFLVYITLGPFWVPGSVGGDRDNRVLGMGRASGYRVITVGVGSGGGVSIGVSGTASGCTSSSSSGRCASAAAVCRLVSLSRAVLQELVPGSVSARAGSSRCSAFGTSPIGAGAVGRARGGAARASAAVRHREYPGQSWTHELERIFETMECAEEDQVRLAVYQLKAAAHEWWRVQTRQTHFQGQRLDHITWQQFLEVFHRKYFPDYARRDRRDKFHELVQGDLTISQYHQRFVRLLSHIPHVAGRKQACAERFIAGLRPNLSSGSCLLAGADGVGSRGVRPGLQSTRSSRELSRAVRRQFATLVAYRATFGGIAPRGKPCSSNSQFNTCSSYPSTNTLPSSRHLISSSRGSTSDRLSSFCSHNSTTRTSSSSSFFSTSSHRSSPSRRHSLGVVVVTVVSGRSVPEHPSAEDATRIEVAILSRWLGRSRHDHGALGVSRPGHNGDGRRDSVAAWLLPLPGTPILGSLLREYSGLRVCSSRRTLELRGKRVLLGAGQQVLFLTASLLAAPEPFGEVRTRVEGKTSPCGGHDEQSYGVSNRIVFPYHASCSFASTLPFVGETSQQCQGARRVEETGQ
ncbi:hypothetical protein Taro_002461 [Colocasia esculenta]|uniref:Retrotransposon gag domain-containing protein n=1 Tax=Colocasia esculenta TaxID=4460 RepID=A0A843TKT3_COLES|nr:hypothetical protein [Colocasia esculenta]